MNIPELQQLARAATPGPWKTGGKTGRPQVWGRLPGMAGTYCLFDDSFGYAGEGDAAFIAACDPQTVLALTEAVEAARNYLDGHDRRGDKLRDALAELEVAA